MNSDTLRTHLEFHQELLDIARKVAHQVEVNQYPTDVVLPDHPQLPGVEYVRSHQ